MSRISERDSGCSQGGGRMFARRWRLRSEASQRGTDVRRGGMRGSTGPCNCWVS
jgi:hypothetical protein